MQIIFDHLLNNEPNVNYVEDNEESKPIYHGVENEVVKLSRVEIDMAIKSLKNKKNCRRQIMRMIVQSGRTCFR